MKHQYTFACANEISPGRMRILPPPTIATALMP
jgi:hypothetical protein